MVSSFESLATLFKLIVVRVEVKDARDSDLETTPLIRYQHKIMSAYTVLDLDAAFIYLNPVEGTGSPQTMASNFFSSKAGNPQTDVISSIEFQGNYLSKIKRSK